MARKPWDELKPSYRARLERKGVTEFNRDRVNLQRARGHRAREHLARQTAAGLSFSSTDRAFLNRQQERMGAGDDEFSRMRAWFRGLTVEQRQQIRERVNREAALYRRRHSHSDREADAYFDEIDDDFDAFGIDTDDMPIMTGDNRAFFYYH